MGRMISYSCNTSIYSRQHKTNKVTILNRWGKRGFGKALITTMIKWSSPGKARVATIFQAVIIFYRIEYTSGKKNDSGYFTLKAIKQTIPDMKKQKRLNPTGTIVGYAVSGIAL